MRLHLLTHLLIHSNIIMILIIIIMYRNNQISDYLIITKHLLINDILLMILLQMYERSQ